ncbi:peptide MFS transporter [Peribacillus kribbensis]|uniref:peptide MFS transporter n=1 Tax=Peribacillus kribbensis TaxID=356658 RepID=UPI000419D445|nr:peptide MFS transporter [Peribacillus kribbensis]
MEAAIQKRQKHPKGLYLLFFTEMWERFSYYGMRGILVLYLTKKFVEGGLAMNESYALSLYGFFTGAVYLTPLIGGWLTDRFIPKRLAITIGGVTMALGNIALFSSQTYTAFYIGLALLIIGNGFFKPNISTLVGELYKPDDARKDAAFTIFYMGINLGAFISPLLIGYFADDLFAYKTANGTLVHAYNYGFLVSAIGMIIGQILFNVLGNRYLGNIGKTVVAKDKTAAGQSAAADKPLTKKEKQRTTVIVILTAFVVFFWAGFEQAGSSLTIYTDKFIDRSVFGWEVPTAWFQSINPIFIIILAPIISSLWLSLSKSKRGDLKIPTKMGLGMILLGVGFVVLILAITRTGSDPDHVIHKANLLVIILTYFFHTVGELFLSPVGLSLVSKIAPVKLASLLMGVWLASSGIANILAGQVASVTQSLGYLEVFAVIGGMAILLGLILLAISKKLNQMME